MAVETARGVFVLCARGVARRWRSYSSTSSLKFCSSCSSFRTYCWRAPAGAGSKPLVPALRGVADASGLCAPSLELAISVAHISDEEPQPERRPQQDGIEALVEAAQEEGILAGDEAQLIEQVVEFSDKRVLEVMTPRPDIVAIPANATIEQMRRLLVETKFSRVVVYAGDARRRRGHRARAGSAADSGERSEASHGARNCARPALFVPETKLGSELLKEMQRRNQHMADRRGRARTGGRRGDGRGSGGRDRRRDGQRRWAPRPDVVREADGSVVLRGSVSVEKLQELFGIEFTEDGSRNGHHRGGSAQ